ncbi:MAG: cysteine--tRNA ligase [Defluviitaleaceae bacterium]|nr:cysteine--tRNA ligase [Defluviitaleaceae bacterium]
MKIYNSLTRKKEELIPITPGKIKMYTCGQTVYNDIHIGNARFYVAFDAIRRYLEYKGYEVDYVQNFTDIDDKLIQRAAEENTTVQALAEKYIARTLEDLKSLNVKPATHNPKATEEITEIIAMIEKLAASGNAYEKNGSVYFDTTTAPNYGKLSKKNIDDLLAGARVEVSKEKRNPSDFILWKPAKPGEPAWESPWGPGRPGWHIECSAMVKKYLGNEIDIHGGGSDLIFPHHENEIAQSEAANCCGYARIWMHSGMITSNHKKMSKSQGNFQTLREVAEKYPYDVIRFFLVSGHYRMPMELTDEVMGSAQQGLNRILTCRRNLSHAERNASDSGEVVNADQYIQAFEKAMDDDFNTADAVTAIYELVSLANKHMHSISKTVAEYLGKMIDDLCGHLGLFFIISFSRELQSSIHAHVRLSEHDPEVEALITARQAARTAKDFAESDRIRDQLTSMGIILEDTPTGPRWHRA